MRCFVPILASTRELDIRIIRQRRAGLGELTPLVAIVGASPRFVLFDLVLICRSHHALNSRVRRREKTENEGSWPRDALNAEHHTVI